jgi:hypothetical protein
LNYIEVIAVTNEEEGIKELNKDSFLAIEDDITCQVDFRDHTKMKMANYTLNLTLFFIFEFNF